MHGRQGLGPIPVLVGLKPLETGHLGTAFYISLATGRQRIWVEWAWAAVSEAGLVESSTHRGNLPGKQQLACNGFSSRRERDGRVWGWGTGVPEDIVLRGLRVGSCP